MRQEEKRRQEQTQPEGKPAENLIPTPGNVLAGKKPENVREEQPGRAQQSFTIPKSAPPSSVPPLTAIFKKINREDSRLVNRAIAEMERRMEGRHAQLSSEAAHKAGNVLIDRDVLLALGQVALKAPPGESGGVVIPPAHSSAPDKEPKKKPAKGRPPNRVVQSRYEIIRSIVHLEGEQYCAALRGRLSTPINWQKEHPPCPKDYLEAWNHADPKQQKKWRKRISDEKYRATRQPKKHSS